MRALNVWCVTDGKPGHRSQLEGLRVALGDYFRISSYWIDCQKPLAASVADNFSPPDLILAAGHRTHLRALRLKWTYKVPLVVLMKPSLPRRLFDLCVIPEHDGVAASGGVINTVGMLNDISPSGESDIHRGLVMLGGPAKHYHWSDRDILQQLVILRQCLPAVRWTVTTSRRTPESLNIQLQSMAEEGFEFVPVQRTDRQWLRSHLHDCGTVWVTEDSASMVYEGLSAGASVGILKVTRRRDSRVSRGLDKLLARHMVVDLETVKAQGAMPLPEKHLCEAQRVAQYIEQWLN